MTLVVSPGLVKSSTVISSSPLIVFFSGTELDDIILMQNFLPNLVFDNGFHPPNQHCSYLYQCLHLLTDNDLHYSHEAKI